ncbi:MAG: BsuPI-related putative proteinase inhibitor [Halobacteriaceae archaeon]
MGLAVTLDAEPDDDTVTFTVTVTNTGATPRTLTFPTGQLADVAVTDDDTTVWRWSEGRMFTQAIREETIDPGDSLAMTATWERPAAGTYTVEATIEAANTDLGTETTVTV